MRTNITSLTERLSTEYKFRGVDIGGNMSRSINMWSIDPETFEYKNIEVYHSKAKHSENERNPSNTLFDEY